MLSSPLAHSSAALWEFRPEIALPLLLAGLTYLLGWMRLRGRGGVQVASFARLAAYWGGLGVLLAALMSPLDALTDDLFFMHMIQHLVIMMVAAPLLWLGNPFPILLWGLPGGSRIGEALFARASAFRRMLATLSRPGIAPLAFVLNLWAWHDPRLYGAAQGFSWVHYFEHIMFIGAAMWLWWHVIGAGPRLHRRPALPLRVGYLLLTAAGNMIPGVIIAMASTPLYPHYASAPRLWGLSVMQDQMLSGLIMWIPGTMMYLLAVLIVVVTSQSRRRASSQGTQLPMRARATAEMQKALPA